MRKDIYITYIGAKGVALSWIGAVLGPIFLLIGVTSQSWAHSLIGASMLLAVIFLFKDGLTALKAGEKSDFAAFSVIPMLLLVCGIGLAYFSHKGYI
jgi:hypothetical protein